MKKEIRGFGIIPILMVTFLSGCAVSGLDVEEKPQAAATYEAFLTNTIQASVKVMYILTNYIDVEKNVELRSKAETEILTIYDIIDLLDSKTFDGKLTRSREDGEISLEEELDEIAEEFEAVVEQIAPDPTEATTLDGFDMDEDGNLVMGGDMVISPKTIDGALTIELLNASARGEDVEAILESLGTVTEDIISNYDGIIVDESLTNSDDAKGLYMANVLKWHGGRVTGRVEYYWSANIPDAMKANVLTAMRDWETKTGNRVEFVENNSLYYKTISRLGLYALLRIKDVDYISGGRASIGTLGLLHMTLNWDGIEGNTGAEARVARHELGHVLGLQHEHQRYDRDQYITVVDNLKDEAWYNVINQYRSELVSTISYASRIVFFKVLCFWIPIRVWDRQVLTSYKQVVKSIAPTPYDYFSIMHYSSGMTSKTTTTNYNWGQMNVINVGEGLAYNTNITEYDAFTVMCLY